MNKVISLNSKYKLTLLEDHVGQRHGLVMSCMDVTTNKMLWRREVTSIEGPGELPEVLSAKLHEGGGNPQIELRLSTLGVFWFWLKDGLPVMSQWRL